MKKSILYCMLIACILFQTSCTKSLYQHTGSAKQANFSDRKRKPIGTLLLITASALGGAILVLSQVVAKTK